MAAEATRGEFFSPPAPLKRYLVPMAKKYHSGTCYVLADILAVTAYVFDTSDALFAQNKKVVKGLEVGDSESRVSSSSPPLGPSNLQSHTEWGTTNLVLFDRMQGHLASVRSEATQIKGLHSVSKTGLAPALTEPATLGGILENCTLARNVQIRW